MKTPYLIQRGKFVPTKENKIGIDKVLDFDYMGSAEFEFGELPKSLDRIHKLLVIKDNKIDLNALDSYSYYTFTISGIQFELFCKANEGAQTKKYIEDMAYGERRCKEPPINWILLLDIVLSTKLKLISGGILKMIGSYGFKVRIDVKDSLKLYMTHRFGI